MKQISLRAEKNAISYWSRGSTSLYRKQCALRQRRNIDFKYACEILRLYSQSLRSGNTTLIQNTFESPTADETIIHPSLGTKYFLIMTKNLKNFLSEEACVQPTTIVEKFPPGMFLS
jgi:hypothetical protein